jgi:chromosomal replication initiation ATPase DnaA
MISYYLIPAMVEEKCIIEHIVLKNINVSKEMISLRSRKNPYCKFRQIMFYFRYKYTIISSQDLGLQYNITNHATVIHARKTVQDMIDTRDPEYYPMIMKIDQEIKTYINGIENGK